MEYLTERDLEYFRRRAEEYGDVLILELTSDEIRELDVEKLLQLHASEEPINEAEIRKWIEENRASLQKRTEESERVRKENESLERELYGQAAVQEGKKEKQVSLAKFLQRELNSEQREFLGRAIAAGLSEEQILILMGERDPEDWKKKVLESITESLDTGM